jgi:chemotaxis protein MotB
MRGKMLGLLALVALFVVVGLGCEATVPKKDYDALGSDRNKLLAQNKSLQGDLETSNKEKDALQKQLADLQGKLPTGTEAVSVGGRPAIRLDAAALYASGKAQLTPQGQAMLKDVATQIKRQYGDCEIRVEGHTDTDPINKTKGTYDTNWDLGAKRANEVVVFLTEKCGIDPKRIYSASYSMFRPVGTSKTKNRRVDIVLLPPMTPGSSVATGSMTGATEEK